MVTTASSAVVARELPVAASEEAPTTIAVALVAKAHHLGEHPVLPCCQRNTLVAFVVAGIAGLAVAGVLISYCG